MQLYSSLYTDGSLLLNTEGLFSKVIRRTNIRQIFRSDTLVSINTVVIIILNIERILFVKIYRPRFPYSVRFVCTYTRMYVHFQQFAHEIIFLAAVCLYSDSEGKVGKFVRVPAKTIKFPRISQRRATTAVLFKKRRAVHAAAKQT